MDKWARRLPSSSSSSFPSTFWVGLSFVSAALVMGMLLGNRAASSSLLSGQRAHRKASPGAFWLVVQITFKEEKDVQTFEKAFTPLAAYVTEKEPHTVSYAYARSDKDPKKIMIYERYRNKEAYLDIHKSSEPFLKFRPQLQALGATIEGESYLESNLGFV